MLGTAQTLASRTAFVKKLPYSEAVAGHISADRTAFRGSYHKLTGLAESPAASSAGQYGLDLDSHLMLALAKAHFLEG